MRQAHPWKWIRPLVVRAAVVGSKGPGDDSAFLPTYLQDRLDSHHARVIASLSNTHTAPDKVEYRTTQRLGKDKTVMIRSHWTLNALILCVCVCVVLGFFSTLSAEYRHQSNLSLSPHLLILTTQYGLILIIGTFSCSPYLEMTTSS
jgi:hypothetical protein